MHRLPLQHPASQNENFLAFFMACCNASTRDVCPVPEAIRFRFCKTIVLDLVFLQILEAKIKSDFCSVGSVTVTVF
jgi:hypothetical protein